MLIKANHRYGGPFGDPRLVTLADHLKCDHGFPTWYFLDPASFGYGSVTDNQITNNQKRYDPVLEQIHQALHLNDEQIDLLLQYSHLHPVMHSFQPCALPSEIIDGSVQFAREYRVYLVERTMRLHHHLRTAHGWQFSQSEFYPASVDVGALSYGFDLLHLVNHYPEPMIPEFIPISFQFRD